MPDLVGFRKTSLVDYPGKVAAAIFFPGCNLRCPWCHNRELVLGGDETKNADFMELESAFGIIEKRRAVLGGVAISGGEPLLRTDLGRVIERIKTEGLSVKLDTNGTLPDKLEELLERSETAPDYIALDLKIAPDRYRTLAPSLRQENPASLLKRSAARIAKSGIPHEFRSLALPSGSFSVDDLAELAPLVDDSPWFFSAFRPGNCLDPAWDKYESGTFQIDILVAEAIKLGKDGRRR